MDSFRHRPVQILVVAAGTGLATVASEMEAIGGRVLAMKTSLGLDFGMERRYCRSEAVPSMGSSSIKRR